MLRLRFRRDADPALSAAAAQLVLAHIDEDPGQPGLEELGLPQLPAVPEGAVHRLVHRVHRSVLPAQVEEGCAVEPTPLVLGPEGEFLFRHAPSLPF